MVFKKYNNMKLLPIVNPNYKMKETPDKLIRLLRQGIIIVDKNDCIIGWTINNSKFNIKEEFIYGTIIGLEKINNMQYKNATIMLSKENIITKISNILYD